jgi:hypothetical protein
MGVRIPRAVWRAILCACAVAAAARAASAETIRLAWDPSADSSVSGYVVYVHGPTRDLVHTVDVGNITSYAWQSAQPGTQYFFSVAAYSTGGLLGAPSPQISHRIEASPVLVNPGPLSSRYGNPITLQLSATDRDSAQITYAAAGLPPGLRIVPSTGAIAGTPTAVGQFLVTATASDGILIDTQTFTWTVTGSQAATPVLSPAAGLFIGSTTVSIATVDTGATIRYTLDGSTPTASSPAYSQPLTLTRNTTVTAQAFAPNRQASGTATGSYLVMPLPVSAPVITPGGGSFTASATVSIASPTNKATIRYTLDGSTPTSSSTLYSSPFALTRSATVTARAFKTDMQDSAVSTASITIVPAAVAAPNRESDAASPPPFSTRGPQLPIGNVDGVTPDGFVKGWSLDPNLWAYPGRVQLNIGGPLGVGTIVTRVNTYITRADINAIYGITGAHGFSIQIPKHYRDGKPHTIYVYGIDQNDGNKFVLLPGSGVTYTDRSVSPPPSIPAPATPRTLVCSPASQPGVINAPITFSASGGTGAYSWSTTGGNPATGSGSTFTSTYTAAGSRIARVTSGSAWADCTADIAPRSPPPPPLPTTGPQLPIGNVDEVTRDGLVKGWSLDPNLWAYPGRVQLNIGGPLGIGTIVTRVNTYITRADINATYGITGAHGFSIQIPKQYRDGKPHTIYVYGIDQNDGNKFVLLPGSGVTFIAEL